MSRLMAFFSPHPDEDPTDSAVESYSLQELHTAHTYPPAPQPASAMIHSRALEPTSLGDDFTMALYKPSVALRRMREEEDQRPNKVVLKEMDHSSGLRDDVRELRYSYHELLLRKRHVQMDAHSRESEMQFIIGQYRDKNAYLEREKVEAITSLEQQHRDEVTAIQNRLALDFDEAQNAARVERDNVLAERDALYQQEILVAREKQLADNETELTRLAAEYGSKIASLNTQIRRANTATPVSPPLWRHLAGKTPVATHTNILGFSPIPDARSASVADEEPQTSNNGNAEFPFTSLLADVPIEHATVGMLAEALAKALQVQQTPSPRGPRSRRKTADPPVEYFTDAQHRENKANVRDLFKEAFHLTKDDEYMLHVGASRETISFFIGGTGPGPDPLALQWDMTTTHKSDWNQKVIDLLCSLYITMQGRNHWTGRSQHSIRSDITNKFDQCRRCWRKARPQVLSDGTHETMQQVGDRLIDHTNERLRLARVLSRRTTKFETRRKVTSALLSDRKATGKEDLPVWVYLHSIVETLDKDGMSSDESESEDCEVPVFRLKTMPWRANFSHEMQIIDEQRAGAAVFTPRGSKPAKRLHTAKRGSIRPAVVGLPSAFYNPLWLSDQHPPIKVSNTKFQRIEIMVARR